ncbi:hypothetical protein THIX_100018 [Thiomonas sp. X19]|nr:hypothetical protein THIX_100018 [Thiomonas sp. X19]
MAHTRTAKNNSLEQCCAQSASTINAHVCPIAGDGGHPSPVSQSAVVDRRSSERGRMQAVRLPMRSSEGAPARR